MKIGPTSVKSAIAIETYDKSVIMGIIAFIKQILIQILILLIQKF